MGLWRRRWEGGGHQPRDGRLEPPEAGRGGKDPPLETLQGAQPRDGCLEPPEARRGGEDPPLEPPPELGAASAEVRDDGLPGGPVVQTPGFQC